MSNMKDNNLINQEKLENAQSSTNVCGEKNESPKTVKQEEFRYLGISASDLRNMISARKAISNVSGLKCEEFLLQIQTINCMNEDDTMLGGRQLKEWNIPDWAKGLVFPCKVSLTNARKDEDLLDRPNFEPKRDENNQLVAPVSFGEWNDILEEFSTALTKKTATVTTLDVLKQKKLLTSVTNPAYNGKCSDDESYPIPLIYSFKQSRYCGLNIEDVFADKLRDTINDVKNGKSVASDTKVGK